MTEKRQAEAINTEEYDELLELTEEMEEHSANRLFQLTELAQIKKTIVPELMKELNL